MASESPAAPSVPISFPAGSLAAGRRIAEAIVIGLVGSTSLYLVGSVYVAAYFGRLSIDAASLDLAPPSSPSRRPTPRKAYSIFP